MPDEFGFESAFGSVKEGLHESYKRTALEYAYRRQAAEMGTPLKSQDTSRTKLQFMEREEKTFRSGSGDPGALKTATELSAFKLPAPQEIYRKDAASSNVVFNKAVVDQIAWVLASAPLDQKFGVRDFRSGTDKLIVSIDDQSQRVSIGIAGQKSPFSELSYRLPVLALGLMTSIDDFDDEYHALPYGHIDQNNRVSSKCILVFTGKQKEALRQLITAELQKRLK